MRKATFAKAFVIGVGCGGIAVSADAQSPATGSASSPSSPLAAIIDDLGVTKIRRPASWLPGGLLTPHTRALFDPPVIRFRNGRATLADRAIARSTHAEFGPGAGQLTLDLTRIRRSTAEAGQTTGPARDRSSILLMEAAYAVRIGGSDTIRLIATLGKEKHKTAIAIADARSTGTSTRAMGTGWRHGGFQLDAGWFEADALRSATTIDRNISLAAGSAIAEHGYQAGASAPLSLPDGRRARLGIQVVNGLINRQDRSALGTTMARDVRTTLSFGIQFH